MSAVSPVKQTQMHTHVHKQERLDPHRMQLADEQGDPNHARVQKHWKHSPTHGQRFQQERAEQWMNHKNKHGAAESANRLMLTSQFKHQNELLRTLFNCSLQETSSLLLSLAKTSPSSQWTACFSPTEVLSGHHVRLVLWGGCF